MLVWLSLSEQVRNAASADIRMRRVLADIGAVMPAALALLMSAWSHIHSQSGTLAVMHRCTRSDKNKPQIVPKAFH